MTYDEFAQLTQNNTGNGYVEYSEGNLWFHISQFDSAALNIPMTYSGIRADLQFDQLQMFDVSVLTSNDAYSVVVENTWNGFKLLKYKNTTPISSVAINEPTKFSVSENNGIFEILFDDEVVFSYDLNKILSLGIGAKGLPGNVGNILKLKNVQISNIRLGFYNSSINKALYLETKQFASFVNTNPQFENIKFNSKINTDASVKKQQLSSQIKGVLGDTILVKQLVSTITVTSNADVDNAQIVIGYESGYQQPKSQLIDTYRTTGLAIVDQNFNALPFYVIESEYFTAVFKANLKSGDNTFYILARQGVQESIDYWDADIYDFEDGVLPNYINESLDDPSYVSISTDWSYHGTHSLKLLATDGWYQEIGFGSDIVSKFSAITMHSYHNGKMDFELGDDGWNYYTYFESISSSGSSYQTYSSSLVVDSLSLYIKNPNLTLEWTPNEPSDVMYIDYMRVFHSNSAITNISVTDLEMGEVPKVVAPLISSRSAIVRTSADKINDFLTIIQRSPALNKFNSIVQLTPKLFNSASMIQLSPFISLNDSTIRLPEGFDTFSGVIILANSKEETNFVSHVKGNVEYEIIKHYPSVVHSYQLSNYQSVIKNANSFETGVYTSVILKLRSFRYPILITLLHYYDTIDDFSEPYDSDSYYNDVYDTELNYVSINQEDNPSMDVENYTVYTQWGDGWLIQKEVDDVYSLDERSCVS